MKLTKSNRCFDLWPLFSLENGFLNQALQSFAPSEHRSDAGFLVENFVFQEIMKYKTQHFKNWEIHFWRTKSGAEVDFIIKAGAKIVAIEVKYQTMKTPKLTRGFRSFMKAYQPELSVVITKSFSAKIEEQSGIIHFVTVPELANVLDKIQQ